MPDCVECGWETYGRTCYECGDTLCLLCADDRGLCRECASEYDDDYLLDDWVVDDADGVS